MLSVYQIIQLFIGYYIHYHIYIERSFVGYTRKYLFNHMCVDAQNNAIYDDDE